MVATLFVQIDGIEGDSVETDHPKWVVVDSIGFGLERHSEQEGGAVTRGFGKATFQPLTFSSEAGNHTVKLMQASAAGKVYDKIVIHQCKAGEEADKALKPYIIWVLQAAMVQSYSIEGSAEDIPKENWSIKYGHISCTYYKTDPKTMKMTKGGDFGWDVGEGKLGGAIEK